MSDDEYYSDNDSVNNDSDNEDIVISSNKKPVIFKPSINIKAYSEIDDSEPEDANDANDDIEEDEDEAQEDEPEEDDVEIDNQEGGAESDSEEEEVEDDDEDSDIEIDEDGEPIEKVAQKSSKPKKTQLIVDDDEDDEDEYDENYLQKFDNEIVKNYVNEFHPECLNHNYDEITKLSVVVKNSDGIIVDPIHRTIPYLTKYEKARVLGQRAKQIETGAKPLVKVPENIIDGYIIAELELKEKKIPFIIRRPIPGGGCEYWNLRDLEIIAF